MRITLSSIESYKLLFEFSLIVKSNFKNKQQTFPTGTEL